ncbi:MAG TPA: nitrous oxide reductase accessory protein NosL [Rubrivivax sp.]|nr:nitrous oxide reductase accessory protein NosL [Rubrivivax sp.]
MRRRKLPIALLGVVLAVALVSGCERRAEQAARRSPNEVLAEATGYYCGMRLVDHDGPKGQVQLASGGAPIWFSSVRDTLVFLRLPEEPRDIAAAYVNDMGRSKDWKQPDAGAWVDPRDAWFVIDSRARSGMGTPEAVPFSDQAAAEAFRVVQGGRVVRLDGIPDVYLFDSAREPAKPPAATP